jgi:hypothetical protein
MAAPARKAKPSIPRLSPRAIFKNVEESVKCGCSKRVLDIPPLDGDWAIPWSDQEEYAKECEREERRMAMTKRGERAVEEPAWKWMRRRRGVGTQTTKSPTRRPSDILDCDKIERSPPRRASGIIDFDLIRNTLQAGATSSSEQPPRPAEASKLQLHH